MNTANPIRKKQDLENLKSYYKNVKPNCRNDLLIIMGLNTALRISDMLALKWGSVYNFETNEYKSHLSVIEQKTNKKNEIYLNKSIITSLSEYQVSLEKEERPAKPDQYLFPHSNKNVPISRVQAFRLIKDAADYYHISGVICCHSLRKTFGYHAWKQGVSLAVLVDIYNHSSYQITKRYLGIEQEDRDKIFREIQL